MKDAERKALLWATDYFRDYKPRDKKQEKQAAEEWRSLVIRRYDACRHDEDIADLVSALTGTGHDQLSFSPTIIKALRQSGPAGGFPELRNYVACKLEQGVRLPKSLAEFAAAFLRDPRDFTKASGRKPNSHKFGLDMVTVLAMRHITETWGLKPTRNVATRDMGTRTCAASIVKVALKTGAGIRVTESRIAAAWRDNHAFIEAWAEAKYGHLKRNTQ